MKAISLFSGCGLLDLALERAGIDVVAQCEIDAQRRGVLERHWPDVPRFSDVLELADDPTSLPRADFLAGGSPCQDFSVAGGGDGLDGERGRLVLAFAWIADQLGLPVLWEQVPSVLNERHAGDFAKILGAFTGWQPAVPPGGRWLTAGVVVGPKRWAVWRVLDGQFFGVPQRRRRLVLFAGHHGARPAPEILLEPEGLRRHSREVQAPGAVAGTLTSGGASKGGRGFNDSTAAAVDLAQLTCPDNRSTPRPIAPTLASSGKLVALELHQDPCTAVDRTGTLTAGGRIGVASFQHRSPAAADPAPTLTSGTESVAAVAETGVRRLTPREYERLQGAPDDWTRWLADGTELKPTPRYRMVADGVVVPHFEWVGSRVLRWWADQAKEHAA